MLNLPNFVTLLRIASVPVFLILLFDSQFTRALILFVLAGATDSVDGAIARLTNRKTTLGAFIDPLADKMLLLSSFLALAFIGVVPRWLVILVVSRDIFILLGYSLLFLLTQRAMTVEPSLLGKASTFLQLLTITIVLFSLHNPQTSLRRLGPWAFLLTALATGLAGLQYTYRGLRWLQRQDSSLANLP